MKEFFVNNGKTNVGIGDHKNIIMLSISLIYRASIHFAVITKLNDTLSFPD